jgi:hypothetical protein
MIVDWIYNLTNMSTMSNFFIGTILIWIIITIIVIVIIVTILILVGIWGIMIITSTIIL